MIGAVSLLLGTTEGVYRAPAANLDDAELVLDAGNTLRVRTFENLGSFAATKTGLYHSADGGASWTNLDVPRTQVDSVVVSPDGSRLYAGSPPGHIYVSSDSGDTWSELEGFRALPSRGRWGTPRHGGRAHVRSLGVHPDTPHRLIAGVEVGGVHVSEDDGVTWTERRNGLVIRSSMTSITSTCWMRTRSWRRVAEGSTRRVMPGGPGSVSMRTCRNRISKRY